MRSTKTKTSAPWSKKLVGFLIKLSNNVNNVLDPPESDFDSASKDEASEDITESRSTSSMNVESAEERIEDEEETATVSRNAPFCCFFSAFVSSIFFHRRNGF